MTVSSQGNEITGFGSCKQNGKKLHLPRRVLTLCGEYAECFLRELGNERLASLSADYESPARMTEIIETIKSRIAKTLTTETDLVKALALLSGKFAVRIMTIHKSKGLEFDTVVILGVERQAFFGKIDEERCAFFVGVSRAKRHLILTHVNARPRPEGFTGNWSVARQVHPEFIEYARQFCAGETE